MTAKSHIVTIYSRVIERGEIVREGGFFQLRVEVSLADARASGDSPGFVKKEIARHLAGCVASTGLPLNEGLWRLKFTTLAQTFFNYPEETIV